MVVMEGQTEQTEQTERTERTEQTKRRRKLAFRPHDRGLPELERLHRLTDNQWLVLEKYWLGMDELFRAFTNWSRAPGQAMIRPYETLTKNNLRVLLNALYITDTEQGRLELVRLNEYFTSHIEMPTQVRRCLEQVPDMFKGLNTTFGVCRFVANAVGWQQLPEGQKISLLFDALATKVAFGGIFDSFDWHFGRTPAAVMIDDLGRLGLF
jgi:hypothetical protein